jgi:deoxyhypusine synthase
MNQATQKDYLKETVEHIDIKKIDAVPLINSMSKMAFQARNLARAADIYDRMLTEKDCAVMLCLAGSLISAGLKSSIVTLLENNMVDAIVSTGANIVDQDFFEALGFRHYLGTPFVNDHELRDLHIDRIYDTYINEDELRICDNTIGNLCNELPPRAYSSREFIQEMGAYLVRKNLGKGSIVRTAYEKNIPIFVPAFSDCSAGFGLVMHQWGKNNKNTLSIDSAKDFLELTRVKVESKESGLLMVGGGVPKNFAQDTVVAAELLGKDAPMHKYAVQITVADERDGALSGSTLKEACSWGKVDTAFEQMVFSEATIAFPLITAYAYQKGNWKSRKGFGFNKVLETQI